MKKNILIIFILSIATVLESRPPSYPEQFAFNAEYLYMLNSTDQPYFAQEMLPEASGGLSSLLPTGTRLANNQSWHSGYRLEGVYGICNYQANLCLRWTHFPTFSDARTIIGPASTDTSLIKNILGSDNILGGIALGKISNKFDFYSLEGLYEYSFINCCPFFLAYEIGIQYAHIKSKEHVFYASTSSDEINTFDIDYISKRDAIGLEMGLEFEWAFTNCFSFNARGLGSLLASKKNAQFNQTDTIITTGTEFSFFATPKDDAYWIVIPAVTMRAGLGYSSSLGCRNISLGVGYEFLAYFNALDRIAFPNGEIPLWSFNQYRQFILHGLYAEAGIAF